MFSRNANNCGVSSELSLHQAASFRCTIGGTVESEMRFCRPCFSFAIALLATGSQSAVRTQSDTSPPKQATDQQADRPKRIYAPSAPFPNETLREKYKEGKIRLSIVVDSEGRVSHAEPLTGSPELFRAALSLFRRTSCAGRCGRRNR